MNYAPSTLATAARRALVSGSVASVLSTAALAACGRLENDDASGPVNGPSQWLWGRWAARVRGPSVRHTLLGHAVHHVCACGWALLYERWVARDEPLHTHKRLAKAAATAALASFVDYQVAPKRLRPGFEMQLTKPSLLVVYAAFAVGLVAASRGKRSRDLGSD
jgi:hypothetical protein